LDDSSNRAAVLGPIGQGLVPGFDGADPGKLEKGREGSSSREPETDMEFADVCDET